MGSRVERGFVRAASTLKAEETGWKRVSLYGVVTLLCSRSRRPSARRELHRRELFIRGVGSRPRLRLNAVHHLTMMAFTLLVILALRRRLGVSFGLGLGDKRAGIRFVSAYTAILAGVSLVVHTLMLVSNALQTYTYPLSTRNVVGTLGFQLLLTGPTEELLYRALPLPSWCACSAATRGSHGASPTRGSLPLCCSRSPMRNGRCSPWRSTQTHLSCCTRSRRGSSLPRRTRRPEA